MKYPDTMYCMYVYYSSGWTDCALLLLKIITHTHSFILQIFFNLSGMDWEWSGVGWCWVEWSGVRCGGVGWGVVEWVGVMGGVE
jgi:hypothetical protein